MTHEKIYKRGDGSQIKVSVWLYVHENKSNWGFLLWVKEAGSEHWVQPFRDQDYMLRVASPELREGIKVDSYEHYISKKEILQAKMELWNQIKPV